MVLVSLAPFDGDLHHLQVTARAESGIGASQDDGADVGIGIKGLQRPPELTRQRGGKHVEPVGFVERDHRSVAAVIDTDPFGRIRVVAGRNHRAVQGIRSCVHWVCSSISLARNTAHAAVAKVSTASSGILASPPAIQ